MTAIPTTNSSPGFINPLFTRLCSLHHLLPDTEHPSVRHISLRKRDLNGLVFTPERVENMLRKLDMSSVRPIENTLVVPLFHEWFLGLFEEEMAPILGSDNRLSRFTNFTVISRDAMDPSLGGILLVALLKFFGLNLDFVRQTDVPAACGWRILTKLHKNVRTLTLSDVIEISGIYGGILQNLGPGNAWFSFERIEKLYRWLIPEPNSLVDLLNATVIPLP